jgi:O-antigen/teichoic acid export membrane protein
MQAESNNKRIAKNTLYLYIRMLVSMAITLYTSRVILQTLGIDDFGIYNIVGGIIVLFGFVSHSLRTATQRFVSFHLGQENQIEVNRSMNMSLQCHFLIAVGLAILAETVGLWFVMNKLNIPDARLSAALWVYQFSILTFIVNMFQAPYQAVIISYEKMSFYAGISIVDVFLKLAIVYLLLLSNMDNLILYAFLMLFVSVISLVLPMIYCYKKIGLGQPSIVKDRKLFKDIFGFAGWSMITGCAFIGTQQGGNILLNVYNGVAANGAFGIANQVTNAVYGFVSNFQSAFNPQIVKYYSAGQFKEMYTLLNRSASFSYYLYLLLAVPFLSQTDYILTLWLGESPQFAAGFCQLLLVYFIVDAIQAPLWMLIGATGKIKVYSIYSGTISLLSIPLAWLMLSLDYSIYWVFIMRVIMNVILGIIRPFYLHSLVPSFSVKEYLNHALKRASFVTFIIAILLFITSTYGSEFNRIVIIGLTFLFTVFIIWTVGLSNGDRKALKAIIINKIKR